jgi:heptosyltransferase-2
METLRMEFKRILFVQTAFIGDAILALPALQKLKSFYPDYLIDVLCIPESKEIFEASPIIENAIVLDKKGKQRSLLDTLRFTKNLKKNNYKKLYSAHRSLRTSLIVSILGIKESYGFDTSNSKFVYKNIVKYNLKAHEVQRNFDLINFRYNENNWRLIPEIKIDDKLTQKIQLYLNNKNIVKNFIAIAPGSVWETKKYPSKYFTEIINYLVAKQLQVVLVGSKKDWELCNSMLRNNTSLIINTAGELSIIESIQLLRSAKLLVCNDSAPTHMGIAADIRVLTIYCSTIPDFGFYPYNNKSQYISFDDLDCKPCGIHGHNKCPIKTFDCGEKLIPQTVIKKMEEMINDE